MNMHIPPAALEAGALVIFRADEDTPFGDTARTAFVAMVTAWEGMFETPATFLHDAG